MSKFTPLGPWPAGIQNTVDATAVSKEALLEANNVLIGPTGEVETRTGFTAVADNVHSLYEHSTGSYAVFNGAVSRLNDSSATTLFPGVTTVSWGDLQGRVMFATNNGVYVIDGDVVTQLGVETPVISGGSVEGEYLVTCTALSSTGEESAAAPPVVAKEGDQVSSSGVCNWYQTKKNGDVLYFVGTGITMTVSEQTQYGSQLETLGTMRAVGGLYPRYWNSRLLITRGRTLFYSLPFRYGLFSAVSGYVRFEGRIDFVEPLETGVFVAVRGVGVYFLSGATPEEWSRTLVSGIVAQRHASLVVSTVGMKLETRQAPERVAVWFNENGFAVGLPSGDVIQPQADRLQNLHLGDGMLHYDGERFTLFSQ